MYRYMLLFLLAEMLIFQLAHAVVSASENADFSTGEYDDIAPANAMLLALPGTFF